MQRSDTVGLFRAEVWGAALVVALLSLVIDHTSEQKVMGLCLAPVLAAATVTDLRRRKIPNSLTTPAAIWALLLGLVMHPSGLGDQALCALAAGGFMFIFAVMYPKGLGMGDVKLSLVMGLYLSSSVAVAMFVGLVSAAAAGLYLISQHGTRKGRKMGLPLAPFLALGGVVAILIGPEIVHWYAQHQSLSGVFNRGMASSGR